MIETATTSTPDAASALSAGVFTIGYGARSIEDFVRVLQANGITYLIDMRSRPYSRYKPEFSKEALDSHLQTHQIRYIFMGDTLGGQPNDPDCYTDGKVDYEKCRRKPFFLEGIGRLRRAWEQKLPVAIMCSEGKPENCHRSKLIAPALVEQGIPVSHIDENDQLISQQDVMLRITGGQRSLFGDDFHKLTSRKRYVAADEQDDEPDVKRKT